MKSEALRLLRDPRSHHLLCYKPELPVFVNLATGETYPITGDIVRFIRPESLTGRNRYYMKFYDWDSLIYDPLARVWGRLFKGGEERMRREFLDHLEVRLADSVLEVSVGTGGNLQFLPRAAAYYGLDISAGMLARCRKRLRRCGREALLVQAEAEHLPFADNAFDVVFHMGAINFFNDKAAALREMVRVGKPGCKLLVADGSERAVARARRWSLGLYGRTRDRLGPPIDLLPAGMLDISVRDLWDGDVYCLTFRKPAATTASQSQ